MSPHKSLKEAYYISFSMLIALPILLVFLIALGIIRMMVYDSAISAIQNAQTAAAAHLEEGIKDASLQLSHFVYVNDNELMRLAALTDTDDDSQRHHYARELDMLFGAAMAPRQKVLAVMIYRSDGSHIYLKQEIAIPWEELIAADWYQQALDRKNTVIVGGFDPRQVKITGTAINQKELVMAAALSPDRDIDRTGKIDGVVLFFQTGLGRMLQEFNQDTRLGQMAVLDTKGSLLFGDEGDEMLLKTLEAMASFDPGVHSLRLKDEGAARPVSYTAVISPVPGTGWSMYSCVRTAKLTGEFNQIAAVLLGVIAGLFLLYMLFSGFFLQAIIKPISGMVAGLNHVEEGALWTRIEPRGHDEIRQMIHSFNQMAGRLSLSVQEQEAARQKKLEAEIKALQSQINPHFLVNSLNSIRFMAQVAKYDGIRRMAEALIRILTCSFRSNSSFYTIREELEVLDSYLYLMKIRYSDGFEVFYDIQDGCQEYFIPRLILQPIVENSIVHGFTGLDEDTGRLFIRVWEDCGSLYVEVEDNGPGLTAAQIGLLLSGQREEDDNYNIGIRNVYNRLKLNFGKACSFDMSSAAGSFLKTTIRLPVLLKKEGEDEAGHYR